MIPPVKLSAAERIINALAFVPRKRGEDFMARHKKEADAMRPIIEDVRREGVIEGRAQAEAELQSRIDAAIARERERIIELVELKRAKFNIGTRASLALSDVLDQIRARSGAKGV